MALRWVRSWLLLVVLLVGTGVPATVSAHANLERSTPLQDAVLKESPGAIRLQFTESFDAKLSQIKLEDANGKAIAGKLSAEDDRWLVYTIPKLDSGIYKVKWQVLSVDTHVTEGSFRFSVAVPLDKEKPSETISLDGDPPPSSGDGKKPDSTPAAKPETGSGGAGAGTSGTSGSGASKPPTATKPPAAGKPTVNQPSQGGQQSGAGGGQTSAAKPQGDSATAGTTDGGGQAAGPDNASGGTSSAEPGQGAAAGQSGTDGGDAPNGPNASGGDQPGGEKTAGEAPDAGGATAGAQEGAAPVDATQEHAHHHDDHAAGDWRTPLYHALRIVEVVTAASIAGLLFFNDVIWRGRREDLPTLFARRNERRLLTAALFVFAATGIAHVWMLAAQLSDTGGSGIWDVSWTIIQSTMVGTGAWLRPLLAAIMLALTFVPVRGERPAAFAKWAAALALIALFPLTGHAYAAETGAAYAVASHMLHTLVAAAWFGGLAGIFAATCRRADSAAHGEELNALVRRFSRAALPLLIAISASGVVLSLLKLQSWSALFQSDYGQLVLLKTALVLAVIAIGAYHRLALMPRMRLAVAGQDGAAPKVMAKFAAYVRLEIALAAVAFAIAGTLSTTAPPEKPAAFEPVYWHVMGEDAHMSLRINPDPKQSQSFRLDVWLTTESGQPSNVSVVASRDNGKGEQVDIPFEYKTGGPDPYGFEGFNKYTYETKGNVFPDPGSWQLSVDIADAQGQTHHYEKTVSISE